MSTVLQRELHAQRGGLSVNELEGIMKDTELNAFTQAELLCTALPTYLKDLARAHYRSMILVEQRGRSRASKQIDRELERLRLLGLDRSVLDSFAVLPPYSLGIEFTFILEKPYLSRDDDAFYIIDNPVRKEKVFKVPYVAASSWKGGLRAAATRRLLQQTDKELSAPRGITTEAHRDQVLSAFWPSRAHRVLLFGNEKKAYATFIDDWLAAILLSEKPNELNGERRERMQKMREGLAHDFEKYLINRGYRTERIEGRRGRLHCFPTYFDRIGLEVINPHDRERGVGTNPILLECVPAGAKGRFSLLYVPFDYPAIDSDTSPAVTPDESTLREQISDDLRLLGNVISDLLTVYGFGAKTSSGYGTVADQLVEPGRLILNTRVPQLAEKGFLPPDLEDDLKDPDSLSDFVGPEGEFESEEKYSNILQGRGQNYNRKKKQLYKRVRCWWDGEGEKILSQCKSAHVSGYTELGFPILSELPKMADQLAEALGNGGGEE